MRWKWEVCITHCVRSYIGVQFRATLVDGVREGSLDWRITIPYVLYFKGHMDLWRLGADYVIVLDLRKQ